MIFTSPIFKRLLKRKLVTALFISASIASFATLGDGNKKSAKNSVIVYNYSKTFSLKSNFNFKCNELFNEPESKHFIMINAAVTYQQGNAAIVMPLKKKILLEKVTFKPTSRF